MIKSHPTFKGEITDAYIQDAAERYGYEGYLPFNFIRDLVSLWTCMVRGTEPDVYIEDGYDKSFLELVSLLKLEYVPYMNCMEWVMGILKTCRKHVNFRDLEYNKKFEEGFIIQEEEDQFNYEVDLKDIHPEILDLYDVDKTQNSNEIELSEEVRNILNFYDGLKVLNKFMDNEPKITRSQMKDYNQVMKVPKHKLIYPTFKYDLTKKNLLVKIPEVIPFERSEIVLLVDSSYSTYNYPKYKELYKAILTYFYSEFDENKILTIYYFNHYPKDKIVVKTKERLKELINTPLTPYTGIKGWDESEKYFSTVLANETIVFLTDGTEENTLNFAHTMKNNTWYIVALNHNEELRALANRTNGKFIEV